jgi:hypothetical protein
VEDLMGAQDSLNHADRAREDARRYLGEGRAVLPVHGKVPWDCARSAALDEWQMLRLTPTDLPTYFAGAVTGVGVLTGPRFGGLTDIDLDCDEALAAADVFLPQTRCVFGRPSKPQSHRIYVTDIGETTRFKDVNKARTTLVELRAAGAQTVFPRSLHESGEPVRFDEDGEPARVAGDVLRTSVAQLAATTLLARYWPRQPGSRHDLALALAGYLLRGGVAPETAAQILETAAGIAGDPERCDRGAAVRSTDKQLAADRKATGRPTLIALLGEPGTAIVEKLTEWLGLHPSRRLSDEDVAGHARQRPHARAEAPPPTDEDAPPPGREPGADDHEDHRGTQGNPWQQALSAPAFLREIEDTPEWLVEDVLIPAGITRVNSPRGLGKTNLGHAYAVTVARAGRRVLLFDRDNPKTEIRRRLRAWGADALDLLEILSREHAPALTDARAWKQYPIGKYDLIVIDSWDASTEGVGEQDSAKPSKAQAVLLDLAHRTNGPAVLVLANTTKAGEAGRGAGTLEDREEIVLELRDATGFTPSGRPDWWSELPDASRGSWADRAARRTQQDRLRLACVYSKFRVGVEPPPFVVEVDFTTSPWSLRLVTAEVVDAGEAAKQAATQQAADRATDAVAQLRAEIVGRARAGQEPYSKKTAALFLTVLGITWKRAYELIDQGIGTDWTLVELTTKRGKPMVLSPVGPPSSHSKSLTLGVPAAEGLAAPLFGTPAPSADVPNSLHENPCTAMGFERGAWEPAGVEIPPSRDGDSPISNGPTGRNRDESPPGEAPSDPYGPAPPATPCRTCGGDAWHRAGSGWTCATCHPLPTALPHPPGDSLGDQEPATLLSLAAQHGWGEIEYTPGHRVGGSEDRWKTFARGGLPEARRAALAVLERMANREGDAR